MTDLIEKVEINLPEWMASHTTLDVMPQDIQGAMKLAIELSRLNVTHRTGGPFGALVLNLEEGEIIASAVNCVEAQSCSSAHAEIMALSLAQQKLGTWNLSETDCGPLTLMSSCEPCAMCLGAIPWSGIHRVICGATKSDAERAGFDEGARPEAWINSLQSRGVEVITEVCREEAADVLLAYAHSGRTIYNP